MSANSRSPRIGLATASVNLILGRVPVILLLVLLFAALPQKLFGQEDDPEAADSGDYAPAGVAGSFGGTTTSGCGIDVYSKNFKRTVDDVVIPSSAGSYPLKFSRTYNSKDLSDWENDLLPSGALGNSMGADWRHSYSMAVGSWHNSAGTQEGEGFVFPDGRLIPQGGGECPLDLPPMEERWDGTAQIWRMPDGGKIHLGHGWSYSGVVGVAVDQITDPYGQITTVSHYPVSQSCPNCDKQNRIYRVTEPGGRYLEFTYHPAGQNDPVGLGLIKHVEAYDSNGTTMGISAEYHYQVDSGRHYLNQVDYSDGTQAVYTWDFSGNGARLVSADDPHFDGPMRHIEYHQDDPDNPTYVGEYEHWTSSSNFTLVTKVSKSGTGYRTETRGDGATRVFKYFVNNIGHCSPGENMPLRALLPPFHGFLDYFEDFNHKRTTLTYYTDDREESYRHIKTVKDANGNITEYIRNYTGTYGSWAITKIISHPAGTNIATCGGNSNPCNHPFVEQSFVPDPNSTNHYKYPYYLATRTALREPGDAPHTTSFTRNAFNHATNPNAVNRIDYPDGAFETFVYNAKGQVTTHQLKNGAYEHFEYDSQWRLTKKWNPTPNASPVANDPKTTFSYYGPGDHPAWSGRIKTETFPPNESAYQASKTYEYDRAFVSETEFGFATNSGSETSGRGLVTKITHADGTYQQFRHNIYGDKIWEKNELGQRTVFTYDKYGRVTSVKDPLNNQRQTSYLKWSQLSSYVTTSSMPFIMTLASGKQTYLYYDDDWRKTQVTQAPGVTGQEATATFTYDDAGNLKTETNPRGKTTTHFYDFLNRVIHTDDPMVSASPVPHQNANGHTVSYTYNSRGNKATDLRANGQLIEYLEYDAMNRLKKIKTWRDATTADIRELTYDLAGNIQTRKDERGKIYTYGYDASGRKTSLEYPDDTTDQWTFDNAGNPHTYTTRAGQTLTRIFDNRNREIANSWDDENTLGVYKDYDAAGRLLTEMTDQTCISYTYDTAGRLTSETQQTAPDFSAAAVIYHYADGANGTDGNRSRVDYPYGHYATYGYTGRNQVGSIFSEMATADYTYDLNGNEGARTLDNGASESCTYNAVDRLTQLNHVKSSASFSKFDYTHNRVNDCLTRTETIGTGAVLDQYAYDLDDQVTEARYNFNSQNNTQDRLCGYVYDPAGNRSSMTDSVAGSMSYSVNDLNQYTSAGGASLQYDSNGNLTSQSGWTYEYDAQNRLFRITGHNQAYGFVYDSRNRCVARQTLEPAGLNAGWEVVSSKFFYYDGWDLIEEHTDRGDLIAAYLHGVRADEMIAKFEPENGTVYYHTDAEGSVVALTNTSGTVVERYTYDIFGKPKIKNGNGTVISGTAYGNRFLFTGREWLADLELYDYRNRVYSAEFGRFLQTDPKSFDADPSNLYRYCGNDPIDKTDPMGLLPVHVDSETDNLTREAAVRNREGSMNEPWYYHTIRLGGRQLERSEYGTTVWQDGSKKALSATYTNHSNEYVLPRDGVGKTSLVYTHYHPNNNFSRATGSYLSVGDVAVGIASGKTVQAITPSGIENRYRPSEKTTWEKRYEEGGVIEQRNKEGTWSQVPGSTDRKVPHWRVEKAANAPSPPKLQAPLEHRTHLYFIQIIH